MNSRDVKDTIEGQILHLMLSIPKQDTREAELRAWLHVLRPYLRCTSTRGNWKDGSTADIAKWRHDYAIRNREKRRLQKIAWRTANPEQVHAQARRWATRNREKMRFYVRHRRYLQKSSIGSHTLVEWHDLKQSYAFKCPSCLRSEPVIKLTEDHIIPLSQGGTNDIQNIQPLCRSCNSRKFTKTIRFSL
jgi:5-methylcytosine-specific restriction endonuclease McrA